jgi:hypothetical protein
MNNFLRLTRADNGSGLGDAIMQINFVYKLCQYFDCEYVHSPIESVSHASKYDEILGLHKYPQKIGKTPLIKISVDDLRDDYKRSSLSNDFIYAVIFDYVNGDEYYKQMKLNSHEGFPWLKYFNANPVGSHSDVLIHLRFGDSFCYPLSNKYYFDARNKKICNIRELNQRYIWSLSDFEYVLEKLYNKNKNIKIISDGIMSGYRSLDWNDWGKGFPRDYIKSVMSEVWGSAQEISEKFGLVLTESSIEDDINKIVCAEKIIATEGSFVRHVNFYLRQNHAKLFDIVNDKKLIEDIYE